MRYWKRTDAQGKTTTVESYSHDRLIKGAIEITVVELNAYIASLPLPIAVPVRNLAMEIDQLTADIVAIKLALHL